MKTFLRSLLLLLATTAAAHAFQYSGKYYAVSYDADDQIDAAVNLKIKGDGSVIGRGASLYLDAITVKGAAKNTGKIVYKEIGGGQRTKTKGSFQADGKKFTVFTVDDSLYGEKIADGFSQAGVYRVDDDLGDEGIFIVFNDGSVYAHFNGTGGGYDVEGEVKGNDFNGVTANGQVGFSGTIDGNSISGTYSDNVFLQGTFSATKY